MEEEEKEEEEEEEKGRVHLLDRFISHRTKDLLMK